MTLPEASFPACLPKPSQSAAYRKPSAMSGFASSANEFGLYSHAPPCAEVAKCRPVNNSGKCCSNWTHIGVLRELEGNERGGTGERSTRERYRPSFHAPTLATHRPSQFWFDDQQLVSGITHFDLLFDFTKYVRRNAFMTVPEKRLRNRSILKIRYASIECI